MAKILAFPAPHIVPAYGFVPEDLIFALGDIAPHDMAFMERDPLEQNPSFKQPIAYCLVTDGAGKYLRYFRAKKSEEGRLRGKLSIGIGGHVEEADAVQGGTLLEIMVRAAHREILEEVGVEPEQLHFLGCLNHDDYDPDDDRTKAAVASVHLGVVYLAVVDPAKVVAAENELFEPSWATADELNTKECREKFEHWSQMLARWLVLAELRDALPKGS